MIKTDCAEKCEFIMAVLKKIMKGANVPLSERLAACEKAIEVLCAPAPNTQDESKNTSAKK